jgi:hypothetical protein
MGCGEETQQHRDRKELRLEGLSTKNSQSVVSRGTAAGLSANTCI